MPSILWWCFTLFLVKEITSNNSLDCYNNNVRSTSNWSVHADNQAELDDFMTNATSFTDETANRCIRVSLTGSKYTLDVVKMMQLKLGTSGSLIVVGVVGHVEIDCTASTTNLNKLIKSFKPISNISLVAFSGLVFNSCPVPIIIEEVSVVVVNSCVFQ